jgi:polar amino acid transport system permease protein
MIIDLYGFGPALAAGALMTVKLALSALCLGLVLGLLGALAKTSPYKPLQWLGGTYSTLVRGIPELLWVLLIYFGTVNLMRALGEFFGNPDLELNAFAAGVIALGLCFGAYATEVFRGAILAIPKGHREAGVALGLSKWRIFTKLIMPQMWRIALPGLGNLFMILMKDTALVSVIGLEEIMRHAQIGVTVSKQPFTFYMVAAFMYLSLTVLAPLAASRGAPNELGSHHQMAAETGPGRNPDPGAGGHRRDRRFAAGHSTGHRPLVAPVVGAGISLRLHLLFPWHAVAGSAVPGLLRPGAVRRDP